METERELTKKVKEYLKNKGWEIKVGVKARGRIPDVLATKKEEIIIIEVKGISGDKLKAIGQAIHFKNCADYVYIALPQERLDKEFVTTIKPLGIGIISLNNKITETVKAEKNDVLPSVKSIVLKAKPFEEKTKIEKKLSVLETILGNKVNFKILKLLSKTPNKEFLGVEVAKGCGISVSTTIMNLKKLASIGILNSRKFGKGYIFKFNDSNYFSKIINKVIEEDEKIFENLIQDFVELTKKISNIESIVLFGSALTGLKIGSDIDFLVIGKKNIDRENISTIETELINKYGFHVSTIFMTEEELKEKAKKGEEFVINVIASGKLIYGKILEDIVWPEK